MYEAAYAAKGGVARTLFQLSIILAEEGKEGPAMETLTRAEALRKELIKSTPNVHDPATSFDDLVPYVDR